MFDKSQIKDIYDLTPMQEGMLFHTLLDPGSPVYRQEIVLTISGPLDVEVFRRTFNVLVDKYDILRTVFIHEKLKRPLQAVLWKRLGNVAFRDLSEAGYDEEELARRVDMAREDEWREPYRPDRDIPVRVNILKLRKDEHVIIWSGHHIVMDGWCFNILISDFNSIYGSLTRGMAPDTHVAAPYGRYLRWLGGRERTEGLEYWREYLRDYSRAAVIPVLKRSAAGSAYVVGEYHVSPGAGAGERISAFCASRRLTPAVFYRACWGVVLQRYNDANDVVFATVVSGRPPEVEGASEMVGLFINSIPARARYEGDDSFERMAATMQADANSARSWEYLPLAEIQALSPLKNRLAQTTMGYQGRFPTLEGAGDIEAEGMFGITEIRTRQQVSYDFNCIVTPGEREDIAFSYNAALYDRVLVEGLGEAFLQVIAGGLENPGMPVRLLPLLSIGAQEELLARCNGGGPETPAFFSLEEGFARSAALYPHHLALVGGGEGDEGPVSWSYGRLEAYSARMAEYLRSRGVGAGRIVALAAAMTLEYVAALLGTLQTGAAWLPYDPAMPGPRLRRILDDARPVLMLSGADIQGILFGKDPAPIANAPEATFTDAQPESAACIIYTSGSSGLPKGVVVPRRGLARYASWRIREYRLNHRHVSLQLIFPTFDGYGANCFPTLLSGGKMVIIPQEQRLDGEFILRTIEGEKITHTALTPGMYRLLLEHAEEAPQRLASLISVTLAAEKADPRLLALSAERAPHIELVNEYGPSEASIGAAFQRPMSAGEEDVIGVAVEGAVTVVADRAGQLQPVGAPGEIVIGGEGLFWGYLNNPELTHERLGCFPHFPGEWGARLFYRSGDMGRRLPAGPLQWLGRRDLQLKIRGFRVEPEEIERCLREYPGVGDVVAAARCLREGELELCAWFVPMEDFGGGAGSGVLRESGAELLRRHLARFLPDYMIPAYFIMVSPMPRTNTGKIDREALPDPAPVEPGGEPETGTEAGESGDDILERLRQIWAGLLGVSALSLRPGDNFFRRGGHSLRAVSLVAAIHKVFNRKLGIRDIFRQPLLSAQARLIREASIIPYVEIGAAPEAPFYELSYSQRRMWVLQRLSPGDASYNIPAFFPVAGSVSEVDVREALAALTLRHEAFRTGFREQGEEVVQYIAPPGFGGLRFRYVDLTSLSVGERRERLEALRAQESVGCFDLEAPPLYRAVFVRYDVDQAELILIMHHIVSDGWSMDVLAGEFRELLAARLRGGEARLASPALRYRDYAFWQNRLIREGRLFREAEEYWRGELQGGLPDLALPCDALGGEKAGPVGAGIRFFIPAGELDLLRKLAEDAGASLFMVLLAGFKVMLASLRGQQQIILAIPGAARQNEALSGIVGLFVNTLALVDELDPEEPFMELLRRTRDKTMKVLEYQAFPLELICERLCIPFPVLRVFFNMVNIGRVREELLDKSAMLPEEVPAPRMELTLYLTEHVDGMDIVCLYFRRLFQPATVEAMMGAYLRILENIARRPDTRVGLCHKSPQRRKLSRGG